MAQNPLQDVSLDQLDLSDPETFKFVESNVDINDDETKKYLDQFRPQSRTDITGREIPNLASDEELRFGGKEAGQEEYNTFIADKNKKDEETRMTAEQMLVGGRPVSEIFQYVRQQGGNIPDPDAWNKAAQEVASGKKVSGVALVERKDEQYKDLDRDAGDRFSDAIEEGSLYGFAGVAGRKIGDWLDQFKDDLKRDIPGMSEDFYEFASDEAITNADRAAREDYASRSAADPAWRPDDSWAENILSVNRWGPAVAGTLLGSVGPESVLNPGATALRRMAAQGAISGATNAGYQVADIQQGVADEFSPEQMGIDALAGAGFQGLAEIPGAVAKGVKSRMVPKDAPVENTPVAALGEAFEQSSRIAEKGVKAKPKDKVFEAARLQVIEKVENISRGWTNAPEFEVQANFKDLPDLDPNSIGVTTPEGKVLLNVENIAKEARAAKVSPDEMISAVTFHEALGHHGLIQKFGDELDDKLTDLYSRAPSLQKRVDEWVEKNPNAYADDHNPLARAAEEVFAEMSEKGQISPTLMERFRAIIRDLGRQMGIDLKVNDNELKVILGMAHKAVVSGRGRDVAGNGYRYMNSDEELPEVDIDLDNMTGPDKPKEQFEKELFAARQANKDLTESLNVVQKGSRSRTGGANDNKYMRRRTLGTSEGVIQESKTVGEFRSNRPIAELLDDASPEKVAQRVEDWIDDAGDTKMTTRIAEALASGAEVPELLAARKFLIESGNRAFDLSKKVTSGLYNPHEEYLLQKEMERVVRLGAAIEKVVSNAGRILRSQQVGVESDKALTTGLRNMASKHDLTTEEGVRAAAKELVKDIEKAKRVEGAMNIMGNVLNLPRSIMSSMDFSAPFRQTIGLIHKKQMWKNAFTGPMFKAAFSQKYYDDMMKEIVNRPTYKLMKRSELALTENGRDLSKREEDFMSEWAERIPVLGHLVKGSGRAYQGFLNKTRADIFDSLLANARDAGIDLHGKDSKALRDIARFINVASGRGDLGKLHPIAPQLANVLFSPRLMAARLQVLNPGYYVRLDPFARKEALKSLAAISAMGVTLTTLASMAGANVEVDPRSSDFGKIRVGDTRYDILGGFGQYLTLFARIASNQTKNIKGQVKTLGDGFGSKDRVDVIVKFFTNKESPVASFITDYLRGEDAVGDPFEMKKAVLSRFIPMIASDIGEMQEKYGIGGAVLRMAPSVFGAGAQDYSVTGSDRFGRDYNNPEKASDPAIEEVDRLFEGKTEDRLRDVPKKLKRDGETIELDEEQHANWQKLTGEYFLTDMKEAIADPVWNELTDEEKIEEIRLIRKEAKADALADIDLEGEDVD